MIKSRRSTTAADAGRSRGRVAWLRRTSLGAAATLAVLVALTGAPPARAQRATPLQLDWQPCGEGFECATTDVPRDYSKRRGPQYEISLIRRPATDPSVRIGSLFVNPGGPGGAGVDFLRASAGSGVLPLLNRRFDLVGFDPRGVGRSTPRVRCLTSEEATRQFLRPLPTPEEFDVDELVAWAAGWGDACVTRSGDDLAYLSTANVARDLDVLRAAVNDRALSYLGFSYGTQLGATYAALFPARTRALVLDGAVDPDVWINRPLEATREQVAASERSLGRFFAACAATAATWCDFGVGRDPETAYDRLTTRLDERPVPSGLSVGITLVTGDTLRAASARAIDSRLSWPVFAAALLQAENGRGTLLAGLAHQYWGISSRDGSYDNRWDRFLAISALDQRWPRNVHAYLRAARHNYAMFPHLWWGSGPLDLAWGLYPVRPRGVFRGPFTLRGPAPDALVIGTKYDPTTPYVWAKRLVRELTKARLLTLLADGHTTFQTRSRCVEEAVRAYLETLTLPPAGTVCDPDGAGLDNGASPSMKPRPPSGAGVRRATGVHGVTSEARTAARSARAAAASRSAAAT